MERAPKRRATVLRVNGRAYVAGLTWRPLEGKQASRKGAKRLARDERSDVFVLHAHRGQHQVGLAPDASAKLVGLPSLARSLLSSLGDSWIGAFQLADNRVLVVAVQQGAILPGFDYIGDASEARQKFTRGLSLMGDAASPWGKVISIDPSWGGELIPLEQALPTTPAKDAVLQGIKVQIPVKKLAIAGALLGALAGGAYATNNYLERQADIERRERSERQVRLQQEAQAVAKAREIAAGPWSNKPTGKTLLGICANGWKRVPLTIAGWEFDNGRCEQNALTAVYRRAPSSTVAEFTEAVRNEFGLPTVRESGNVAAINFNASMPLENEGELPLIQEQVASLLSHFQRAGIAMVLGELKKGGVPADLPPGAPAPVAAWQSYDFEVTLAFQPEVAFEGLDMKGLRVETIDLTTKHEDASVSWRIKGAIYGK